MAFCPPEPIPIYLAPMREQMLRLAGRIGDGVVLSAGVTASHTVKSLGWVAEGARAAGRDPAILRAAGYLLTSVSADGRKAVEAVREKLAFLLRNKFLNENIRSSGIPINQEAIVAAVARRDLDEATRLVPDDAVEAFAVAGTPRHCRERLESYVQSGLSELILFIAGGVEDKSLALSLATEFSRS
jgi:5,10-methylenetetrahydromethanopterin reductase